MPHDKESEEEQKGLRSGFQKVVENDYFSSNIEAKARVRLHIVLRYNVEYLYKTYNVLLSLLSLFYNV